MANNVPHDPNCLACATARAEAFMLRGWRNKLEVMVEEMNLKIALVEQRRSDCENSQL